MDTPDFVAKFFEGLHKGLVDHVYNQCITGETAIYDTTARKWKAIPTEPSLEKELYQPFVDVANSITEMCRHFRPEGSPEVRWLTNSGRAPAREARRAGLDGIAADVMPDIVAALNFPERQDPKEPSKHLRAPWTRIHISMEIKPRGEMPTTGIMQLLHYLRQMLQECRDRRFAVGLLLAKRNLRVWLADRAGVLGSEQFDIHEVSVTCAALCFYLTLGRSFSILRN